MTRLLLKSAALLGTAVFACSAQAGGNPYLPGLTNLNFAEYTGFAPKASFTNVDPVGWTGGSGLIYIDSATAGLDAAGPIYLQTYGDPGPNTGTYNYVEADGNPFYASGFNYLVTGLTPGQTYTLQFFQGGSQQTGFGNGLNTTERWIVSLGTSGMTDCLGCGGADTYYGGNDSTYSNTDPHASIVATPLMTTPSGGVTPWQSVTLTLTADATSDLLSFLAWGDDGNTVNLPPIVFLTGVDSPTLITTTVPEPATLALFGASLLGVFGGRLRRRPKSNS